MTRRAVYRWKSFWLGVLVLVFLGWGWMRSREVTDVLTWGYNGDGDFVMLWHYEGRIFFTKGNDPFYHSSEAPGIDAYSSERSREVFFGPDGLMLAQGTEMQWKCPIWMVMLIFSSVWCSWLMWHWLRMRRAGMGGGVAGEVKIEP